ncbi:transcription termination/antitermination protein NusG [Methylobacterium sp. ID0610]|uniref:transcription termination/antitermination protein NusG n=1 Tax=Methylobacterium carpenticola TaxID=3344827 RepID=UPI003698D0C4
MARKSRSNRNRRRTEERRMIDQAKTWFVVQTLPLRERKAVEALAREGVDTWLPQYRVTVKRRGRIVEAEEKWFASYVFVGIDGALMNRLGTSVLFNCEHVLRVLGVREPLPFPSDALQLLADRLAGHDRDDTEEGQRRAAAARFQVGEMRRIVNGPFMSFFAEVEEVLESGVIKAGVRLFGRMTPVEFTPDQLDAA